MPLLNETPTHHEVWPQAKPEELMEEEEQQQQSRFSQVRKQMRRNSEPRQQDEQPIRNYRCNQSKSHGSSGQMVHFGSTRLLILNVILALLTIRLTQRLIQSGRPSPRVSQLTAWASWIGEVPTAAELYGDASAEVPSGESFDDDDEDEELDASATNEYPDNENDESYEDADDQQESINRFRWLKPSHVSHRPRRKRDLEDISGFGSVPDSMEERISLKRRSDDNGNQNGGNGGSSPDDIDGSFNVDDGNEDAWVHDGVDDIHIDPETKRAASELNSDQSASSLDGEYEPQAGASQASVDPNNDGGQQQQAASSIPTDEEGNPIINRTRVTTISEVIPTRIDSGDELVDPDEAAGDRMESQRVSQVDRDQVPNRKYLPASHLSLEQVQHLFNVQQQQ